LYNQRALLVTNDAIFSNGHQLASARFALIILFAIVDMAALLALYRPTRWAYLSDDHSYR
jgi:hypothetical protein